MKWTWLRWLTVVSTPVRWLLTSTSASTDTEWMSSAVMADVGEDVRKGDGGGQCESGRHERWVAATALHRD